MSLLSYRGLPMDIVHTREISRVVRTSRDGMAYHGSVWTFDCDCVYNQSAAAYSSPGIPPSIVLLGRSLPVAPTNAYVPAGIAVPAARRLAGSLPVFTDASLRHWLSQPRGQLIYAVGGGLNSNPPPTVLLQCPQDKYTVDMDGTGPNVTINSITTLFDGKTFLISLRITCVVNESRFGNGGGFPILLSNRFRQSVDTDDDYFATVTTQGEATFRLDELIRRGTTADQYRNSLAPPPLNNFHRGPMSWALSEDGAVLQWQVVDRELAFNTPVVPFNVTRVEVYETRQTVHPNVGNALAIGLSYVLSAGPGDSHGGTLSSNPAERRSLTRQTASTAISIGRAALPIVVRGCVARAWGSRNSRRAGLVNFAAGAALARVGAGDELDSTQARIMQEVSGKFVEFEITHTRVWIPGNIGNANAGLNIDGQIPIAVLDNVTRVRANDDTPGYLRQAPAENVSPPNSSETRGTYAGALQASGVPTAEGVPATPGAPVGVVDLQPT